MSSSNDNTGTSLENTALQEFQAVDQDPTIEYNSLSAAAAVAADTILDPDTNDGAAGAEDGKEEYEEIREQVCMLICVCYDLMYRVVAL